jgi:hypothetical protein
VFPRVLSDKELRQSDYDNSNLILFGTKETNAIIAKFTVRLPVQLSNESKDYGLLYIFPVNKHYVLVNSGLPWWTPSKAASGQGGMAFMGSKVDGLKNFQDFILFRESPEKVISQGSFDNNWNLPADAVNAMKATGIIDFRK